MQHSNMKDRKRRAVKRAPKVNRAAKPKVFIRRNLPERLAEECCRFPPNRKKTKIWKPAFQQLEQSHWVDLYHRWCWSTLWFGWLLGQRGLEAHPWFSQGYVCRDPAHLIQSRGLNSPPLNQEVFYSLKMPRTQFIFTLLGKFGHKF